MTIREKKVTSAFITLLLLCGLAQLPLLAQPGSSNTQNAPSNCSPKFNKTQKKAEFQQWAKTHPAAAAELKRRRAWEKANPAAAKDIREFKMSHHKEFRHHHHGRFHGGNPENNSGQAPSSPNQ